MGLIITNSNDINFLGASVVFDISGQNPQIIITNQSTGPNLAGVVYAFQIKSPTTTYIHDGILSSPDESGVWTTSNVSSPWPRPFGQIEWGQYSFQILAKDSAGNEYAAPVQYANICRPSGNLPTSTNTYGVGLVLVQTKCEQARIYFQDNTSTSYQGLTGVVGSSTLRVNFPMDDTGVVPAPFAINYFTSAMVPVTYSGKGYQFLYSSIWDYELAEDTFVRIKYVKNDTFGVWCNISLMPLICEYQKLIYSIENGSCANADEANQKLMLINPKFSLVVIGMFQPLTGIDVPAVIEEIKAIGGFDCDCCNVATGILPAGSSAFDGYTFSVVPLGGDIQGTFVPNGYNIQLQLSDVAYIFKMCDESPSQTTAFTVNNTLSGDGYTKTYCLLVDMTQLSYDMLNTIKSDAGLVNLFNSIVNVNQGTFKLVVDGKCIFNSSATYSYVFALSGIPASGTFAQMVSIDVSGTQVPLSHAFNMTTLPALQTYLNTLGYGTFVVASTGANSISITSTGNSTNINSLIYSPDGATDSFSSMTKTATGFTPLSANQVVQAIIDYLCNLTDAQVATSAAYEICYVDENGAKQTQTIEAGESVATFIAALTARGCTTIDYIVSLSSLTCTNIKAQFPQVTTEVMQPNDIILATKNSLCAGVYPSELFLMMLTYGPYSAEIMAAFCNMVTLCTAGGFCESYNEFYAVVEEGSPTSNLIVTFDHPSAISNTIRYARIDNTVSPVYTTITGVLPGDSPKSIAVDEGQYRVFIRPIYSDGRICPEISYDTAPCVGLSALNAVYTDPNIVINYTVEEGIEYIKINIAYPNGGFFSQIYSVVSTTDVINVPAPVGVFGTYFVTAQPVCNNSTAYFGAPSGSAAVLIEETSP